MDPRRGGRREGRPQPPPAPGGPPLEMGREVRATKGRPEEARTDQGAVLQPHSTDEGGEPQGSCKGRPRYPLEGREKQAYKSVEGAITILRTRDLCTHTSTE